MKSKTDAGYMTNMLSWPIALNKLHVTTIALSRNDLYKFLEAQASLLKLKNRGVSLNFGVLFQKKF